MTKEYVLKTKEVIKVLTEYETFVYENNVKYLPWEIYKIIAILEQTLKT